MKGLRTGSAPRLAHVAALAILVLLVIMRDHARADQSGVARAIRSACHIPPPADTTGWRVERLLSADGWHFFFRIPPSFRRDPKASSAIWGWPSYTDGTRRIWNGSEYVFTPGPTAARSECIDTLSGTPFTITSSYENGLYHVAAVRSSRHGESQRVLRGIRERGIHLTSPNPADQDLFLTIVRSIEEHTRASTKGTLFFGGHEMKPPVVFACHEGRLTVNGHWLPDLIPSSSRRPTANGELEARRAIAARLSVIRDSLLANGLEWPKVQERMKIAAWESPFVQGIDVQEGSTMLSVSWAFGYDVTQLTSTSGTRPLTFGKRRQTFEEDWHFWTARLDYLKALLDKGGAVFLLGGGCEYVVDPADAAPAIQAARQITQGEQGELLPLDVQEQLRKPLSIELAK